MENSELSSVTVGDFTFNWDFIRGRILGLDNLIKYDLNYLLVVLYGSIVISRLELLIDFVSNFFRHGKFNEEIWKLDNNYNLEI